MSEKMCKSCEEKQTCVPFFEHENAMEHVRLANKYMTIGFVVGFVCMVIITYIFVTGYTSRTKDWLTTYTALQNRGVVTEVADGIQEQSGP